ncbi:MAG: type II toxin-antitoxin system death-on-curing family toxin [Pyrinomonadaceae bacterium]|nr:type II toxin-antitoxin system death-on-curing family toxin [Pyrinomonadaceae bacterium]
MATENFVYLTVAEAVKFHVLYMRRVGETRFGVFDKRLVESALMRPQHAADYENADVYRQAATMLFGLIKSHPWEGGNKRTATFLTNLFLKRNGYKIIAPTIGLIELCLKIESNDWKVDEIEGWLRDRTLNL